MNINNEKTDNNNDEIEISAFINFLIRNKFLISTISLLGTLIGIFYSYTIKPIYSGSFDIIVDNSKKSNNRLNNQASINNLISSNNTSTQNKTQELILKSPLVLNPVYEYVKSIYKERNSAKKNITFRSWRKNELLVEFEKGTNILTVKNKNEDKDLILKTLNMISNSYQAYSKRDEEKQFLKTITYLNEQK